MALERYVIADGKRLRCGYTTGTCAALAAGGAVRLLFTGVFPQTLHLTTPGGVAVEAAAEQPSLGQGFACCAVRKDGGDDIDATHGALIFAQVSRNSSGTIHIDGGRGVGRVTRPGLDQPVGAAAINRVPREMIRRQVREVLAELGEETGVDVVISVPEGEEIAKRTFNPQLGIVGGISILGTTGIVEPMSVQALVETTALELRQAFEAGSRRVILTPGNYGLDFLRREGLPGKTGIPVVKCSNYIGEALDRCGLSGFEQVLLVGHAGKLVKLAGGIMNTHSRAADCRTELFCAHAAVMGGGRELCRALLEAPTSDRCVELLRQAGLLEPVLESLLAAIQDHLERRAAKKYAVGAVLFSNEYGKLGETQKAKEIMEQWRNRR